MATGHRSQIKRERNANKDTRPSAKISYARVSVQKACFVLDAIRGKDVATALAVVTYNPRYASSLVKKLLESAIANAENNNGMKADLRSRQSKEERIAPRAFFTPVMILLFLLIGAANFGLNLMVVLLATMMDGAIVYPAVQGGGPMIAVLGSLMIFGEQITWKKWIAILLGVLAIVLLNL